ALNEYRTGTAAAAAPAPEGAPPWYANYGTLKYAATRADAVGHSQGGQLIRWYVCDTSADGATIDRLGWPSGLDIDNMRSRSFANGKWPYLRDDNFGAGSIRRFVSLNSPFKGSPIADNSDLLLRPGDATWPRETGQDILFTGASIVSDQRAEMFESAFFGNESTCISDLATYSAAVGAMSIQSRFPTGAKRVAWHPISTCVGPNPPPGAFDALGNWATEAGYLFLLPLDELNSDWVVTVKSQKNLLESSPTDPLGIGSHFTGYSHSQLRAPNGVVVMQGPTTSAEIRDQVSWVLSIPLPDAINFNPAWRLGP
ncbi:MAG TPA: hypothetical protein VG797_00885, partial [Phycisphaerales bacterium]|nr:hypothetical protein [Phycisphaerales bacterium]